MKDEVYEIAINRLIPLAEKEAREMVAVTGVRSTKRPGKLQPYYNHCYRTEFFHKAMRRLAIENELRRF